MFLYDANETMKMIGYQCPVSLLCGGGVAARDFKNILDAHEKKDTYSFLKVGIDVFMLGYIYGKRAERSKQKRKRQSANA